VIGRTLAALPDVSVVAEGSVEEGEPGRMTDVSLVTATVTSRATAAGQEPAGLVPDPAPDPADVQVPVAPAPVAGPGLAPALGRAPSRAPALDPRTRRGDPALVIGRGDLGTGGLDPRRGRANVASLVQSPAQSPETGSPNQDLVLATESLGPDLGIRSLLIAAQSLQRTKMPSQSPDLSLDLSPGPSPDPNPSLDLSPGPKAQKIAAPDLSMERLKRSGKNAPGPGLNLNLAPDPGVWTEEFTRPVIRFDVQDYAILIRLSCYLYHFLAKETFYNTTLAPNFLFH